MNRVTMVSMLLVVLSALDQAGCDSKDAAPSGPGPTVWDDAWIGKGDRVGANLWLSSELMSSLHCSGKLLILDGDDGLDCALQGDGVRVFQATFRAASSDSQDTCHASVAVRFQDPLKKGSRVPAQVWVYEGDDFDTLHSGWQVTEGLYEVTYSDARQIALDLLAVSVGPMPDADFGSDNRAAGAVSVRGNITIDAEGAAFVCE